MSLEPHLSYNMSSKSKRKSPDIRSFFQCGIRQGHAPSSKVDDLSNKKAKELEMPEICTVDGPSEIPNDEKSSIDVEMQEETGQHEINYGSESEDLELEEKPTTELPNNKVYDIGDDIFGNCEKKYMNNRETAEYCLGVVKELSEDVKFNILEVLAPYGSQISSSCRGLVAFGHQSYKIEVWGVTCPSF